MSEVLRTSAEAGKAGVKEESEEKRFPLFWRVFGGTLLSIAALVLINVYQGFSNGLHDLRNDMGHLNNDVRKELGRLSETQADLVKKEEFVSRMTSVWDSV
jgi:hypothetical protein